MWRLVCTKERHGKKKVMFHTLGKRSKLFSTWLRVVHQCQGKNRMYMGKKCHLSCPLKRHGVMFKLSTFSIYELANRARENGEWRAANEYVRVCWRVRHTPAESTSKIPSRSIIARSDAHSLTWFSTCFYTWHDRPCKITCVYGRLFTVFSCSIC